MGSLAYFEDKAGVWLGGTGVNTNGLNRCFAPRTSGDGVVEALSKQETGFD